MFSVSVNDLVEELYEENNRLLNELLLTQKCFELLSETKDYIELNFSKYGNNCNSNDSLKYHEMIDKINDVIERRNVMIKKEVEEYYDNDMDEEVLEESCEQSSHSSGDYNGNDMCEDFYYDCSSDEKNNQNKLLSQQYITSIYSEPFSVIEWEEAVKMTTVGDKIFVANDQVFECPVVACEQTFNLSEDLNDHIGSEHSVVKIACTQPDCNRVFTSEGHLQNHTFKYHTHFQCHEQDCEFIGTKSCDTKTSDVNDQLFKCLVVTCGQTFQSREVLDDHIGSEHSINKNFMCTQSECNRVFKSDGFLRNHIFVYHTQLWCKESGCEFSGTKADLKKHQSVHMLSERTKPLIRKRTPKRMKTTSDWSECGSKTRDRHLRGKPIKADNGPQHWCDWPDCGQRYTKKSNLVQHIDVVHKKRHSFACSHPGCDFRTSYSNYLSVHEETHLPKELRDRPLKCDWPECDYSTHKKDALNRHIRSHKNERPFACQWPGCDSGDTLNGHTENQSSELNQVLHCGKRFKTKASLWQHINGVHKRSRQRKSL